ncbi:Transcriptional regulatory protein moc3 [Lachnellula suecica]|uniref:Transcriptional regulatory protein moc3 n=1 Tax=Lachnellula suecica TaxID=602035 RepID=A0A8T9C7P9_9HELO|nr:Transcriptional regulatory protein moc3 [Lachnellula suecica]
MDRRVRTGCGTCRKRRVKCDEAKPICARCHAGNYACEGYAAPRRVSGPGSTSSSSRNSSPESSTIPELSYRHSNWRQEQLPLYHHFVTTTVVRLFRVDHVSFWRDQVAQMSYGLDFVYEALLAIGAIHRSSLLACQKDNLQEAARFKVLGLRAYSNTIRLLPDHLTRNTVAEKSAVLVVLMLLTYFECFLESPKGALRHLWAAIQILQKSEEHFSESETSNIVPLYDAALRLDFIAQKLIPYARSSLYRCPDRAMMLTPFWNRAPPEFSGISHADTIAAERYSLIRLICGHNKLNRIVWGPWCATSERPSRDELMGFYSEMQLWKRSSPATFASCESIDTFLELESMPVDLLTIPPPACHFSSTDAALNIAMFNAYLGCAISMICTTENNSVDREHEAFKLAYQSLCIAAGLIERHKESLYKPCDAISMGISVVLYHGARRCYSAPWQEWTVSALRSIGREGLSNGFTSANTLETMFQLEEKMRGNRYTQQSITGADSPLGPIRDRLIPLLLPRGEDEQLLVFYLRYGNIEADGDERAIQAVAKATNSEEEVRCGFSNTNDDHLKWREDAIGTISSRILDVYDPSLAAELGVPPTEGREVLQLFSTWRQEVETGWHGYLGKEVQDGWLKREGLPAT